jgi:Helicase conserved C-terminal domain
MTSPPIEFIADRMSVRFDRFDLESYRMFLKCKALPEVACEFDPATESYTLSAPARFAAMLGLERPTRDNDFPIWPLMYEEQAEVTKMALDSKRFALWAKCGFGKTFCGLEFARQVVLRTGSRVLITTFNDVIGEWMRDADTFYEGELPLYRLRTRREMKEWMRHGGSEGVYGSSAMIGITNYEKWNPESLAEQVVTEAKFLGGIILDENRLKTGGGKQKWAIIKSCRGIEFKLSLTATPAPNDLMEFASQASFLEKMRSENEIIWTFFTRDQKTHRWTVKPHAREAFFKWMSVWSIYVNDPQKYGWRKGAPEVPRPTYHTIEIDPTPEQTEIARQLTVEASTGQISLFIDTDTNVIQRSKLAQVAKGFRYVKADKFRIYGRKVVSRRVERVPSRKPGVICDLVKSERAAGRRVLIWSVFDAETKILMNDLGLSMGAKGIESLTGVTEPSERSAILDRCRSGETDVLVTRAAVLGWGMNLQMFTSMIFSGWTDSFEQFFQAVRRAYRAGQKESVHVWFPVIRELEGDSLDNIDRKEREFERSIAEMEENYIRSRSLMQGVYS